ncbi:hypothetical protein C5167_016442 [Papaver somniferum]|nr:hypothetical protein C5167_016442 [Papaver somniferum]
MRLQKIGGAHKNSKCRRNRLIASRGFQKVVVTYECKIVQGMLSYQLKQFGNKVVLSVPETRVDEFQENDVYAIVME